MKNSLLLLLFLFGTTTSFASIRYWVGGNGNWSDNATHWSLTSGGAGGAAIPTGVDSVIIDALSGLNSTGDSVLFDTPVSTFYFDYSAVGNAFTFGGTEASIEINGSFIANGLANYFWTGEIHLNSSLTGNILTSAGSAWTNDVKITGIEPITLTDDFTSTADMYVDNGGLLCLALNFTSKDFWATVANTRTIDFSGSTINITGANWSIDNTTLTWLSPLSQINLTNPALFTFIGGDIVYDTVVSSSSDIQVSGDNGFTLLQLSNSSTLRLFAGSTQTIDSLITSGNCGANTSIESTSVGITASIVKTGSNLFNSNLTIIDVNATGPAIYNISSSDTTNSLGWTPLRDFYWIGGTGDWSDGSHWSITSGGAPVNCSPQSPDNAIFDDNSGLLTLADSVKMDIAVTIHDYNFSAVSTQFTLFSILPSIEVQGSLSANGMAGIVWNGDINLNPITLELLTSNGQIWNNDFHKIGIDSIDIVDHFNTSQDLYADNGSLSSNDTITCANFFTTTANSRSIDFDGVYFNLQDSVWEANPNSLTWSSLTSTINLNKLDTVSFIGGSLTYDTIRVYTNELEVYNDNSITLLSLASNSNLTLDNGSIQNIDSLETQGACGSYTRIHSLDDGLASAQLNKTGNPILYLSNIDVNNVDASVPAIYNIQLSDTINGADGWNHIGTSYFWISDGGSWSDTSHWSFSTGGPIAGCSPGQPDFVIFDDLSFTAAGEVVLVDSLARFTSMDWSTTAFPATLDLDTNIETFGDITFYNDLFVTRDSTQHSLKFMQQSNFSPDSALVDCNIGVFMPLTDSLLLISDLIMTDSTAIILFGGRTYSQGNYIRTGSILSIDNPLDPLDARLLDFGSSTVAIIRNFDSELDPAFTFNGGTSNLTIADTSNFINNLETGGLTFYNVTLDFQTLTTNIPTPGTPLLQRVTGNNTFNELRILKGSSVYFASASTQTINDSLVIVGNCRDSIFISTTDTASFVAANLNKAITTDISVQCVDISGMSNSTGNITALFSKDNTNNTNWTFDATPPITAGFFTNGPFCFGDTTLFTDTTSTFPIPTAYSTEWYYNDNTTGFFEYPPNTTDSIFINYEEDTLQHLFGLAGSLNVELVAIGENFCTDTTSLLVQINDPILALITSESDTTLCEGDSIVFSAIGLSPGMEYEFFLNGVSQNSPSINDTLYTSTTLITGDAVGALGYLNGCVTDDTTIFEYSVTPLPSYSWNYSSGPAICDGDSVAFIVSPSNPLDPFTYQFTINSSSVAFTSVGFYASDTLNNNDTIGVIVTDSLSCQASSEYVFSVNPAATTTLAQSIMGNVICAGDLVTFTGSGATTYEFFVDGTSQGPPGVNVWSSSTLASGDTVSVIGYTPFNCAKEAPEFYTYIVNPLPNTSMSVSDADTSICSGDLVTFNGSGASLYEFFINGVSQGPASANSTLNSALLTNNDTIYVEGGFSGCSARSDSAIFTVLNAPTTGLISSQGNSICQQELVAFTASGATNYEFLIDGISQGVSSPTATFSTASLNNGQIVTVIGESNTCIIPQSITFTVLNIPSVSLFSDDPNNILCDGENITLTGANADSYDLYINSVLSVSQPSPTFINPALTVGPNSVYLIGTAANGCSDTSQTILSITVNPIPTVTLSSSDADDIICSGESVTFSGAGSNNYQFFIDGNPLGSMSAVNNITATSLLDGQVINILGSSIGCTSSSNSISITVNAIPSLTLSSTDVDNVYCEDEIVDYTSGGATNYEFIVDGVSQGPSSPLNTINSSVFPIGSYSVQVIGESNNCSNTAVNMITINPLPIAGLLSSDIDNIICSNESVTYTGSGGTFYEFFVNLASQGIPSPVNTFTSSTLANNDNVSVNVSSPEGCISSEVFPAITVNLTPTVSLTNSEADTTICIGDNVDFNAAGATDYEFFIAGISQGPPSPVSAISTTGLLNGVTVEVFGSSNGCISTSNDFVFTVYGNPIVTLTNNSDTTICTGELSDLVAGGATNYQLVINGTPIGGFSPSPNFNTALNNGDIVTINGETNGCVSTSMSGVSYTVFAYPTIASSINTATTICLNDLVTFTASGAMTYDFDINGTVVQSGSSTTFDVSTLSNSDVVTVTGYNGDCASTPDVYNFIVNSMNLDMIVTASNMICAGENATFTASGADEYEFFLNGVSQGPLSTNDTYSSSTLNDLNEITFTGYSTSTLCTQPFSDYILMNVIDEPTITAMSNLDFCEGDSVILVSNLEYGNQWYVDGNPITGETDTSYVAYSSGSYSLDVTSGGSADVWSFGQNATGTFGNGSNLNSAEPTSAFTTELFEQLSSGYDFVLGVTSTNEVYAWGENSSGQLGDGTFTSSNLPQLVPTLANIKTVATSESSSMAVDVTGNTFVWGNNNIGQLATGNTNVVNFPFANPALTNVDSIAGGKSHFVILRNDGTVWTVGENNNGQLGQGNLTNSMNAIQVPGLTNIISVGAGEYQSFAIDNNGNLYVWGNNGSGQLGLDDLTNRLDPTLSPLENVINAQGGAAHSAFLTSDEKVFTAGDNSFGQLGTGNFTNSTVVIQVGVSGADMISTGQYTTLVKRADMSVFGFGNNTEDQLSLTGLSVNTPEHIIDLDGVSFIEASKSSSHVIYSTTQLCSSQDVLVNMLTTPLITITGVNDLLSTISGTSYQWYFNGNPIPGETNQTIIATQTGDYSVEVTFANGCTGVSDVYFFSMVSIENLTFENVNVFPNPTNDIINIQLTQELNESTYIEIRDQAGRLVKEVEFNNGNLLTINVSELENGIYHVLIQNASVSGNIRFVKSTK